MAEDTKKSKKEQQDQTQQSPVETNSTSSEKKEVTRSPWFARAIYAVMIIMTIIIVLLLMDTSRNYGYRTGFTAGFESAVTTYQETPWYSRWWSGITGTFPGR